VLGALPRIIRRQRVRDGVCCFALGVAILANSRPYEGFLVCLPVAAALLIWMFGKKRARCARDIAARSHPGSMSVDPCGRGDVLLLLARHWQPHPHALPGESRYVFDGPIFLRQSPNQSPVYHHAVMRDFYLNEFRRYQEVRTVTGFMKETGRKILFTWALYVGPALTLPLLLLPWVLRDRRIRWLVLAGVVCAAGMELVAFFGPHYAAPITGVILAVMLQGIRHLRTWRFEGRPTGLFLARSAVLICILMVPVQILTLSADSKSRATRPRGMDRAEILARLEAMPGRQTGSGALPA